MKKVNILPCSGIGKSLGTVSRWAAFELVKKIRPETTELICLARLVAADDESKLRITENFNITLDGCPKSCASKNIERNGGKVSFSYLVPKFVVSNKDLKIDSKDVIDPGVEALELAKRMASEIAIKVDELLTQHGGSSQ